MEKLISTSAIRCSGLMQPLSSKRWTQTLTAAGIITIGCFSFSIVAFAHRGDHHPPNDQSTQMHYHGHYWDPFWSGWYPGYAGAYDSNYFYTPTPDQVAAAKKQVQKYFVAVRKARRHAAKRRYIAVQTLNPTKEQLGDYKKKRAEAQNAAAGGGGQMSNRWVASDKLRCVMLFDTQSKQFVGSGCYVIAGKPPSGTVAKFDTYSAEFVGTSAL
jgi:hypothetical protein